MFEAIATWLATLTLSVSVKDQWLALWKLDPYMQRGGWNDGDTFNNNIINLHTRYTLSEATTL